LKWKSVQQSSKLKPASGLIVGFVLMFFVGADKRCVIAINAIAASAKESTEIFRVASVLA
jgi:hypothetical protein